LPGDRAAIPTPPADGDDDVRLVERAQSGDRDAWTILVQRHQDRVYSMCVRMVKDRELATDLAQDTFVKLIQGINSFDGRAKFTTWLTRIAMNVCLSRLRSLKLRRHASVEELSEHGDDGPARYSFEQSREPSQQSRVETGEQKAALLAALQLLDPEQRSILFLCDCHGHSYEQIAETFGVAVGTVKSRIFRARAALRQAIEQQQSS
jgi:RNA polymerase sigma-70 factor (ECF subfamily)